MSDHQRRSHRVPKPKTLADYTRRYGQLKRAAIKTLANFNVEAFVGWLIDTRRKSWSASTWRQNRASVLYGLRQELLADPSKAAQISAACRRLNETPPWPREDKALRTSQQKSKRMPESDYDRVYHAVLAGRSPYRHDLADLLHGTRGTGLRPAEWPSARFFCSEKPNFAWELTVRNAKYDEERDEQARAHGEFRTLRWVELDDETVGAITRWIARANQAELEGTYEKLILALNDTMRKLTQNLFPRRKKRPTLYTGRHEAIARWKLHYVESQTTNEGRLQGLAAVAALSGHASDETATVHYGRPRRGEQLAADFPIPVPDEHEVARVRRRMRLSLERFAERKSRPEMGPPRF